MVMKLSFIILNYNVTELLRNCLGSIKQYVHGVDYEVIVIDNNSGDSTWKDLKNQFPDFKFIENKENVGFARANNLAVQQAIGEFLFILNPDTELEGDYIKELLDFAESQHNFGCLGIRMHDAQGHFLPESKRSVPDMFNSFEKLFISFNNDRKSYYRNDIGEFDIAEVDVITGANLLIRNDVYQQIGGFDPAYFMYGEDIDLCYTLIQKGFRNFYYGKHSMLHHKGESTVKDEVYLSRFYGAMKIFVEKYYQDKPLQKFFLNSGLKLKYYLARLKQ